MTLGIEKYIPINTLVARIREHAKVSVFDMCKGPHLIHFALCSSTIEIN